MDILALVKTVGPIFAIIFLLIFTLIKTLKALEKVIETTEKHGDATMFLGKSVERNFKQFGKNFSESIDLLTQVIKESKLFWLNTDQSLDVFKTKMYKHVREKCTFTRRILLKNDIKNRRPEIEKNLETEFKRITKKEAQELNIYNSVAGPLGQILEDNVPWPEFLDVMFKIVFDNESTIDQKIFDMEHQMAKFVDNISAIIEQRGRCNE